jgi:tRNA dimethylallyltransferase
MGRIPLLVIAGATATGKTRVAIEVATLVGGEIISADSMQIYRHMDIGTGKPTPAEREAVRFHLLDVADPDQTYTVADFQRGARQAIAEAYGRGAMPILCGGTGLYIRSVLGGLRFPPGDRGSEVRRRLERELAELGPEPLRERLLAADPDAAHIHPNDHKRIIRALEVIELTGRPMATQQAVDGAEAIPYNAAQFVLDRPRPLLYEAIERRVEEMLEAGWLAEVGRLEAMGYELHLQSMQALGYGWLLRYRKGDLDLGEATRLIKRDTRRFAKRQLTWFRHQGGFRWLSWATEADIPPIIERLAAACAELRLGRPQGATPSPGSAPGG